MADSPNTIRSGPAGGRASRTRRSHARFGRRTLMLWALLGLCVVAAGAVQVSVALAEAPVPAVRLIVNNSNPIATVERPFVSDAFLKNVTRWQDGEALHPFDQRADSHVRGVFSQTFLKRSVSAVRHYWQQRIFSGRGVPPPELESDAAVVARVQRDRGAIGYVSARADVSGVRVLTVR